MCEMQTNLASGSKSDLPKQKPGYAPGGSLHALRFLSNVRYLKKSEKWYYMLQK